MSILTVDKLSKNYGHLKALNEVSFSVPAGSVFGILGPNGSGKTTLLGIVMNVLNASSGSFEWGLKDVSADAVRKQMGTLLETPNFYHYLSAEDNLRIAAKIKGRGEDDIPRVLQLVNLFQRKDSKFNTFSLGMKQRLAIASTLLGDPDVLVFDEPTNGLDPAGIAEIRELIKDLHQKGKTIIMASHILDEVEKVCTHVAIIQKGVLKKVGSVNEILDSSASGIPAAQATVEIASADPVRLAEVLRNNPSVISVEQKGGELQVTCSKDISGADLNRYCFDNGIVLNKLLVKRISLETKFLEITGNKSDK
ncbi:ABC transporter ATP-binding protein [Ferruginibacter sp. HRS2-29]|uniref:ABC transporter ATP-binding protein n=1 Tax=Ferruginibacter sp. HRS2-29 TaxID=2487334 RepID=UPI0020CE896E|nr:ATP-binding cassette domain-containing protein [Ferruginibacter sp. HRS2-29]MCP9751768.1 ATP-binding cassette domain-containing protein [Ferruginibacter sp. HRS2-29]